MLIKFLKHGKGSSANAASYVLDSVDHLNKERAGVKVLTGDPITFTSICDANPNLWKYTSAVIAWSKEDNPTDQQIEEVLTQFEKHAFSGLEPHQYHMFSTLHIEDDGSKHIHILVPRLELDSGKALNIAPPGHEKYYASLRDYFNYRNEWSRPDDPLKLATTQTPSYINKLEAQAKKVLEPQKLNTLKKKDFCSHIDNYVKTLLKLQLVQTRQDIAKALRETQGIQKVREGKNYLAVTLNDGKTHRLKGDFYDDQFEIGSYRKYIESAEFNRKLLADTQQATNEARELCLQLRRQRHDYYRKTYSPSKPSKSLGKSIPESSESYSNPRPSGEQRLYESSSNHQGRDRQLTKDVNIFSASDLGKLEQGDQIFRADHSQAQEQFSQSSDQSGDLEQTTAFPSRTGNGSSNPENSGISYTPIPNSSIGMPETRKVNLGALHYDRSFCVTDTFKFLADVSECYQRATDFSTERGDSQKCSEYQMAKRSYSRPNQIPEVSHANGDRLLLEFTARATEERKRIIETTESGIKEAKRVAREYDSTLRATYEWLSETERTTRQSNQQIDRQQRETTSLFREFTSRVSKTATEAITTAVRSSETDLKSPTRTRDFEPSGIRPNSGIDRGPTRKTHYTFSTELFERERQAHRLSKPSRRFSHEPIYAAIEELEKRAYQKRLEREQEQSRSSSYDMSM